MSLSPLEYIRLMLDEIEYIQSELPGQTLESFNQNATLTRAFVRSLEIIGEAAKKVPDDLWVMSTDGKGVVMREEAPREATRYHRSRYAFYPRLEVVN